MSANAVLADASVSWVTILLSMCLLAIIMMLLVKRGRFLYPIRNIPHPPALPFLGNIYQLTCTLEEFFDGITKWANEYGDIFLLWVGMRPFIFIYKAEAVQRLLSSSIHIDKSLEYNYLKPWLGSGLLTSSGEKWHFRRKLLTPTFHSGLLEDYLRVAIKETNVLISCVGKEVGKGVFDIVPYAKRATLDVICQTAMGYPINAQTNFNNEYVAAVNKLATISQVRFTNVWLSFEPIFKLSNMGRQSADSIRIIHAFVDKVIADRKAEWKLKRDGNFNEPVKKRQALLDLLLEMSQNGTVLTDQDIREEVNTFMFAGHDTMATSISWILYGLGRYPEYQKKILEEFDEVVGNSEITLDSLNKLIWLDACIKETWRLYPVVPLIARQIYSPINIMGYDIPIGSTVLVNSFVLHRDARHFPEPEVYRPQRFLPTNPKPATYTFVPFSAGSRNCIGWKFATMVVKVMILYFIKTFKVESFDREDQLKFFAELVLVNSNGLRIKITPRDSSNI